MTLRTAEPRRITRGIEMIRPRYIPGMRFTIAGVVARVTDRASKEGHLSCVLDADGVVPPRLDVQSRVSGAVLSETAAM